MYFRKSESFEFSRKAISRIVIVVAVLIIILGTIVGAYFLSSSNDAPTPTPTPTPSATPTKTPSPSPAEWTPNGNIEENEYSNNALFADGSIKIYWKNDKEHLYMALEGQTKGWVAVGFEPSFLMKDTDMIFGWVTESEVIVLDLYSTGAYGPHPPDTELNGTNDILEYGGKETETNTIVEFKRKMNTEDDYDEPLSQRQTITIIWATSTNDSLDTQHNIIRGTGQITLD